jgi:hypothetical protein
MAGLEKNRSSDLATQVAGQQQQQPQQQRQPGARWMNKRAEEEYQRAMEYIVDKDFNLGMFNRFVLAYCRDSFWGYLSRTMANGRLDEFGDPFDDRDMEEEVF